MQVKKAKTVQDVRGYKINCINFQKCPLCFGCRRYSSVDPECQKCMSEDKKLNICNTNLHKDEVTAKMITKNNIIINEQINFMSKGEE
jgi:hypothetical protein